MQFEFTSHVLLEVDAWRVVSELGTSTLSPSCAIFLQIKNTLKVHLGKFAP